MSDIVQILRDLADCKHSDLSVASEAADELSRLAARVAELEAALRPLTGLFLYPDDLGYEASLDIKEDLDWDDDTNDMNTENVFVLRRDIRRARAALTQPTEKGGE